MTTLLIGKGFEAERIATEALTLLVNNVNAELTTLNTGLITHDKTVAALLKKPYIPVAPEPFKPQNCYLGHKPSLIEAPIENFPNLSVIIERVIPSEESDQFDQMHMYQDTMGVEVMVKSEKDEDIVTKRMLRSIEAINNVLMENRTLNGAVLEIKDTPEVIITDCFIRRKNVGGVGPDFFWQAGRIEYHVDKPAKFF